MIVKNKQNLFIMFGFLFFATAFSNQFFGQTVASNSSKPEENTATIKQLLDEVRELRLVLQKTGSTAQRVQISVERVRIQQQRVDALVKEKESMKQKVKNLERDIPRMIEAAAHSERSIELAKTPTERAERERAAKDIKADIEIYKEDLEEMRELELQLNAKIRAEQTKLDELNSRLDSVEREMESAFSETEKLKGKCP